MQQRKFIRISLDVLILSLAWILLTPVFFPPAEAENNQSAPHPGFQAPDFTLYTPDEESHTLSDYQGRPVLVFLWASWCSVCKTTMPSLQEVYLDYQAQGFEILAVNTTSQDSLTQAINFFQAQGFTFPFLLDREGAVSEVYELHALPTAILVRPDGIVEDVVIGSGLSEGYLRAALNALLAYQD